MGNVLDLCSRCGRKRDGAHPSYCKECHAEYQRGLRARDPEHAQKQRAWVSRNPERRLSYKRVQYLKQYGFSKAEALDLMMRTDLSCEICSRHLEFGRGGDKLAIDHDHETGEFRAFLCQDCNILIGKARESEMVLRRAITYVRRFHRKAG